jgi:hypothetical protein
MIDVLHKLFIACKGGQNELSLYLDVVWMLREGYQESENRNRLECYLCKKK